MAQSNRYLRNLCANDIIANLYWNWYANEIDVISNVPGIILPLNLTHVSAHNCPSKYEPYIFLHCAQLRMHTPRKSMPDAESAIWQKFTVNRNTRYSTITETFFCHCPMYLLFWSKCNFFLFTRFLTDHWIAGH